MFIGSRLGRDFPVRAGPVQPHEVIGQVRDVLSRPRPCGRRLLPLVLLREGHGEDRPDRLVISGSTNNINDLPCDRVQAIRGLFDARSVRDAGRHSR